MLCKRRGFVLVEIALALVILAVIAAVVTPRIMHAWRESRESACFSNVVNVHKQLELWNLAEGSWPADILAISADPRYFPENIPACPVSDNNYFLGTDHRVVAHLNGNHTPVPGVPPPPPPPGGPFITWAWPEFNISDGSTGFGNGGFAEAETALGVEDAAFEETGIDIIVGDAYFEGDARLLLADEDILDFSIQELAGGGYIAIGNTLSQGAGQYDMYLVRLDEEGQLLWSKTYGTARSEWGFDVQQTADYGFVMLGNSSIWRASGTETATCVIKVDQDGNLDETNGVGWSRKYDGVFTGQSGRIQETSDGYVITGSMKGGGGAYIMKLDSDGGIGWSKAYGGDRVAHGVGVRETLNGDYVVTGNVKRPDQSATDTFLIKMDSATGDLKWEKQYKHDGAYSDVRSLTETSDGNYVMSGIADGKGTLIKTDSDGNMLWSKTYEAANVVSAVRETLEGGYILVGVKELISSGIDASLIKVNSDGEVEWSKRYAGSSCDFASFVQQTEDGGYVFAGSTESFSASDFGWAMFSIKTDDEGNVHFDE